MGNGKSNGQAQVQRATVSAPLGPVVGGIGVIGRRLCQFVFDSYIRPTRSSVSSASAGPSNCIPIGSGRAPAVKPHGTEMPAMPAMLHVTVNTSFMYI